MLLGSNKQTKPRYRYDVYGFDKHNKDYNMPYSVAFQFNLVQQTFSIASCLNPMLQQNKQTQYDDYTPLA
jgi:hypothetical protein